MPDLDWSSFFEKLFSDLDESYLLLSSDLVIEKVNPKICLFFDCTSEKLLNRRFSEVVDILSSPLFSSIDEAPLYKSLLQKEKWETPAIGIQISLNKSLPKWAKINIQPIDSKLLLSITSLEEIHEIMENNDALLGIASHELKTPLTAIKATSELIINYELPHTQQHELVEDIYTQAERLEILIKEILDAHQIDTGKLFLEIAPVNLPNVVYSVLKELKSSIKEDREITVSEPPNLPEVQVDEMKLSQILTNLITNALKYSPENSPIEIKMNPQGKYVKTSVIDHGFGIAQEDLPKLFGKFHRISTPLAKHIPGTGLGLYIAKGLVEIQGGQITVKSVFEKGSKFSFTLPSTFN